MLISIVTINYNDLSGLKKTMESVFEQSYQEIEYIVIDGGSTDGSTDYIKSQQASLNYWVSEKDSGIYNAMNKGIAKATGDYILFLNSGDWLAGVDVLEAVNPSRFTEDLISCGLRVIGDDIDYAKVIPNKIGFAYMFTSTLPHQSTFIRRSLFKTVGNYDEKLKFVSDWKFFILSVCKFGASFKYIPITLSNYNLFGFSSLKENSKLMRMERKTVLMEEFEPFYDDFKELTKYSGRISSLRKSSWIKMLIRLHLLNKF